MSDYLTLCRTQGRAWCRYTLFADSDRLPGYALAALVQVGFFDERKNDDRS
jgi:hypothetical protein